MVTIDNKQLRQFGLSTGAIIVALFAFLFPWVFDSPTMPRWPWLLALLLWLPALLVPGALRPVYVYWMKIGHVIGWVNTRIILVFLFYFLIFPMGLIMRLFAADPMSRKRDASLSSYRKESGSDPKERLEKPF